MKFPHMNADPESFWKWFRHPNSSAEVELKLLTRAEANALTKTGGGVKGENLRIAREYFRNFRGCLDANSVDIPNTVENRAAMLEDLDFGGWVITQLAAVGDWRDEGKGDSGTGS